MSDLRQYLTLKLLFSIHHDCSLNRAHDSVKAFDRAFYAPKRMSSGEPGRMNKLTADALAASQANFTTTYNPMAVYCQQAKHVGPYHLDLKTAGTPNRKSCGRG